MNPSQLGGFCQTPLKTFTSKTTSPTDYTVYENKKKNQCPFFIKTSLLEEYCSLLLHRVKQIYKDVLSCCEHDKTATLFRSRTKAKFSRRFFKCANNLDHDPCSYFQWADQDPNEYTLALNHPSYLPPPPSPAQPSKITKKAKTSSINKKKETTPIMVTYLTLPVECMQFKKLPKELKNKKNKKENPSPPLETATTVLQEGSNIHEPGTPCTPQELQSIEQLLETTFDSAMD